MRLCMNQIKNNKEIIKYEHISYIKFILYNIQKKKDKNVIMISIS